MKIQIQPNADIIINTLQKNGYEAFAVGGCVRNAMLGITPKDWDICTNAKPVEMLDVFRDFETHDFGLKHGTLTVMVGGEAYEVTTYRVDGVYLDNRRPESVSFTDDLSLDLSRRDFTVNAMAYNGEKGLTDPFGGERDLKNNLLRCVGNPDERFNEDALRIIRGLRFASVYGFSIEEETSVAIHRNAGLLKNIAAERVREELIKLLCGAHVAGVLENYRDVIAVIIPELAETFDFPQKTKHHCYDVWKHTTSSVAAVRDDPVLRMTMLLHDVGKPRACTTDAEGSNHFKGHQKISAELAKAVFSRLRCPNSLSQPCLQLILWHDVRFSGSRRQVKRVLNALGEENLRLLFEVQRADIAAQSGYLRSEKLSAVDFAQQQSDEIIAQGQCFRIRDLAVNGNDLIAAGINNGSTIGIVLNALLDKVIDEKLPNEKESLIKAAKRIAKSFNCKGV